MRSVVLGGLVMVAVLVAGGRPAAACSCVGFTDLEAFDHADVVFTGTLVDVEQLTDAEFRSEDPQRFRFAVGEVVKGDADVEQTIVSEREGASCGLEISEPGPYLVFATTDAGPSFDLRRGELYAGLCGGTRPIADAAVPVELGPPTAPDPAPPIPALEDSGIRETFARLLPVGGALLAVGAALLLVRPVRGK